jgi:AcrR family transcriptional regulator
MAPIDRSAPRGRAQPTPASPVEAEVRPRGRPPVISNERLLEVAREVFLEHGIRATTAEVSRRAGVAEGTLFHRFRSKEELFRAAMQFDPDQALTFIESLPERAGTGDLRATLVDFAEHFLELGRVAVPVMMMSWSNPETEMARGAERNQRYRRVVSAFSSFFQKEMDLGRIAHRDPQVLARMLLGSLHHFCMSELLARDVGGLSLSNFAREVVDVLLAASGVAPAGVTFEAPAQRRARGKTDENV